MKYDCYIINSKRLNDLATKNIIDKIFEKESLMITQSDSESNMTHTHYLYYDFKDYYVLFQLHRSFDYSNCDD